MPKLFILTLLCLGVVGEATPLGSTSIAWESRLPLRNADLAAATLTRYQRALTDLMRFWRNGELVPTSIEELDDALELYINNCFLQRIARARAACAFSRKEAGSAA